MAYSLILINIYIYTYIYSVLNPFSGAHVHVFSNEHLGLDNISGVSSLEKTDSPLSSYWISIGVCIGVGSYKFSPTVNSMPIGTIIIKVFFRQPYC